jgi:UDP-N-acetylmuramyl tripeptide synthase
MRLQDLIAGLDVAPDAGMEGRLGVRVCDITEDSRTAMPGSLFVARRGQKADGRTFAAAAARAGAVAVLTDDPALAPPGARGEGVVMLRTGDVASAAAQLAERFHGEPTSRLALLGVTGTKGKTTVTTLVHQMLNRAGIRCGMIGTVSIDDGSEVTAATLTTPPAIELSRTMARMIDCGVPGGGDGGVEPRAGPASRQGSAVPRGGVHEP